MVGRRLIWEISCDAVLEVASQAPGMGTFPGPVGEEPELEVEMLGFFLQLLGFRQTWEGGSLARVFRQMRPGFPWDLGMTYWELVPSVSSKDRSCYRGPLT